MIHAIDLNADLGEGCGTDAALLALVSTANVACGAHAGDASTMEATLRAAQARGVRVGAHPSYPDREHFGRRVLARSCDEIAADVSSQLRTLMAIAERLGVRIAHVKPHGALYNVAADDGAVARAVVGAARALDPALAMVGLAGGVLLDAARDAGLRAIAEGFADRRYTPEGRLVARGVPGALIDDPDEAAEQALAIALGGSLVAIDGQRVRVVAQTICLHGDGPRALEFARCVRHRLSAAGVAIQPFGL